MTGRAIRMPDRGGQYRTKRFVRYLPAGDRPRDEMLQAEDARYGVGEVARSKLFAEVEIHAVHPIDGNAAVVAGNDPWSGSSPHWSGT